MLPRRNKNSKQILIQKKKVGGPVFQKFDIKKGLTNLDKKNDDNSRNKITPVKPITPKGMFRSKKSKSKRDNGMMGMIYSKKDLLRKKKDYDNNSRRNEKGNTSKNQQQDETKEEMMYRILKNKGKNKAKEYSEDEEEDYDSQDKDDDEEEEETRDFESYKNKFYKKREQMYEIPNQKEPMNIQPIVRKSNSMLPSNNSFLKKNDNQNYGRESDLMDENQKKNPYLNPYRKKNKKNLSSMHGQNEYSRDSSRNKNSNGKKSRSMKPKKKHLADPFKDFEEREKKYDKDILREILELEDMFTQDYSRHIDSMVGLVKKDIAMQASIREEQGPMRFEESISKVKKIVQSKRDSMDLMMAAIRRFEEKFEQLKIRKEKISAESKKKENKSIKYTRPNYKQESDKKRSSRNMHGFRQEELSNSKSMYGLGMNPTLKPFHSHMNNPNPNDYQYQGYRRNDQKSDIKEYGGKKMNMMMKGVHPSVLKDKMNLHPGSTKELRPITKDRNKQKFSMLPQMQLKQRNLGDDEDYRRKRTDTETNKDLMNDIDLDNDLSLI